MSDPSWRKIEMVGSESSPEPTRISAMPSVPRSVEVMLPMRALGSLKGVNDEMRLPSRSRMRTSG